MELYMVVLGGKPEGRHIEQHDVFFGAGKSLEELVPEMNTFWPELASKLHIDSWRKVTKVGHFRIEVIPKAESIENNKLKLYFVNLGGYKPQDMEEYHYKQVVVAASLDEAAEMAESSTFWKHHDQAHVDDKYGIDVDDIYEINDLLSEAFKTNYSIRITAATKSATEDVLEIGYLKIQ